MNLSTQSYNCPIINNCYPTGADEILQLLCSMYMRGEITDDDPEYIKEQHVNLIKNMLKEKGQDNEFVEQIKKYQNEIINKHDKTDIVSDEEETKILNDYENYKI